MYARRDIRLRFELSPLFDILTDYEWQGSILTVRKVKMTVEAREYFHRKKIDKVDVTVKMTIGKYINQDNPTTKMPDTAISLEIDSIEGEKLLLNFSESITKPTSYICSLLLLLLMSCHYTTRMIVYQLHAGDRDLA